jgi:SAM-dependent methyltransferase
VDEPTSVDIKSHWESVWTTRAINDVSWFQDSPDMSLALIRSLQAAEAREESVADVASVVDVGGGASSLVDALLDEGVAKVAVLDVSAAALATSRQRLGERADGVDWVVSDVLAWRPESRFEIWHDRAVLHFLTDPTDQARYAEVVDAALEPGGHVVIGTFAPDGPEACSGLPVQRHDAASVLALLGLSGRRFERVDARSEDHVTPAGAVQKFSWVVARG